MFEILTTLHHHTPRLITFTYLSSKINTIPMKPTQPENIQL